MKTFNSTLAIVAIALTSVFGFTSCDKDNEAFNNGPKPQKITISSETVGNGTDNKTTTTYTVNDDTIKTTITTTTESANDTEKTAKDFAGTYKYTSEDGKEWVIVLTENAGNAERHYSATITVPEGASVDAKTYEGEYRIARNMAIFNSTEKTGDTFRNSTVSFGLTISKDNPKNTNVVLKISGKTAGTFAFVKQ